MYKNCLVPIQIFLVLEKINVNFFTSRNSSYKILYFLLNKNFIKPLFFLMKKELFLSQSIVVEASSIDTTKYNLDFSFFKKIGNMYYIVMFNYKYNFYYFFNFFLKKNQSIDSLDLIYKNMSWLEREVSEMYGINFNFKMDSRKLLLDYSKKENPLLKNFPSEGLNDVYYNFFDNQVNYLKNEVVEL